VQARSRFRKPVFLQGHERLISDTKSSTCYALDNQNSLGRSPPARCPGRDHLPLPSSIRDPPQCFLAESMSELGEVCVEVAQSRGIDPDLVAPRIVVLDLARLGIAPGSSKGLVGGQGPPIEPVFEVAPDTLLDRARIRLPLPVVDRHEELDDENVRHREAPKIAEPPRANMGDLYPLRPASIVWGV
jgi:hypothetical protein